MNSRLWLPAFVAFIVSMVFGLAYAANRPDHTPMLSADAELWVQECAKFESVRLCRHRARQLFTSEGDDNGQN